MGRAAKYSSWATELLGGSALCPECACHLLSPLTAIWPRVPVLAPSLLLASCWSLDAALFTLLVGLSLTLPPRFFSGPSSPTRSVSPVGLEIPGRGGLGRLERSVSRQLGRGFWIIPEELGPRHGSEAFSLD